jgi:hypothetical protein
MLAAERVIYGEPFVLLFNVNVVAPDCDPIVAEVVTRPVGIVQVPPALRQYVNWIDPTVAVVGTVKLNKWLTVPPALEPPSVAPACSVSVRVVSSAAYAGWDGDIEAIIAPKVAIPKIAQ